MTAADTFETAALVMNFCGDDDPAPNGDGVLPTRGLDEGDCEFCDVVGEDILPPPCLALPFDNGSMKLLNAPYDL